MPDAAAKRRERKKQEEERWRRILAWYMMQHWETARQAELAKYESLPIRALLGQYVAERGLAALLRKRVGDSSPYELLQEMDAFQEADSPFRKLLQTMERSPGAEQEINDALADCIREAPERILRRERRRSIRIRGTDARTLSQEEVQRRAEEERRLNCEMRFLKSVMPPELYKSLAAELQKQGRMRGAEQSAESAAEAPGGDYADYTARHRVEPVERGGVLANADAVFTAAAYQIAAWEQKDAERFDEKKADARAMEISGMRAFRTYMQQQPGSLLAAARGTALDFTHDAMLALDAAFTLRDRYLRPARDALKRAASGKSAEFHRMANELDHFLSAEAEPPRETREALIKSLGRYVLAESAPGSRDHDRTSTLSALSALRALTSDRDFARLLETVNRGRDAGAQIDAAMLDALSEQGRKAEPAAQPQIAAAP